jgi:hypothetical protein
MPGFRQCSVTEMMSYLIKLQICALGLTVMLVSSGAAAKKMKKPKPAASQATVATSVPCRGANLFHCGPIYNSGDYLGDDPDPFIRLMIQRDLGRYGGD